jgi:hypothetical protein
VRRECLDRLLIFGAHYWADPDIGNVFDETLGDLLRKAIMDDMPHTAKGRWVVVKAEHGLRWESDGGPCEVLREFALQSLAREASKLWICEWLITGVPCLNQRQSLGDGGPKLLVKKWKTKGLRAPRGAWLDFKGGFIDGNRSLHRPRIGTTVPKIFTRQGGHRKPSNRSYRVAAFVVRYRSSDGRID